MEGCPKHGTQFLVKEGSTIYCKAKIEPDKWGCTTCYYHVSQQGVGRRTKGLPCKKCKHRTRVTGYSYCADCRREINRIANRKYRELRNASISA